MIDLRVSDALQLLKSLAADSVQLIATDPPYFQVKDEPWDRAWNDSNAFLEWLDEIVAECQRVLTPNGSLYLFASPQMAARVQGVIAGHLDVLNEIVWVKNAGWFRRSSKETLRTYATQTERIIFAEQFGADGSALRGSGYAAACSELHAGVFEPIREYLVGERDKAGWTNRMVDDYLGTNGMAGHYFGASQWALPTRDVYEKLQRGMNESLPGVLSRDYDVLQTDYEILRTDYEVLRREYEDLREQYEDLRRPFSVTKDVPFTDVWNFATIPPGKAGAKRHPCAKPLELMEHIVRTSSRPGDLVCDPFLGSGATAVAAHNLGRDFVGGDALPEWVTQTEERIAAS